MNDRPAIVPMVTPSRQTMKADAVWVTVLNWAEAMAERYGASEILSGEQILDTDDLRRSLFTARSAVPTAAVAAGAPRRLRRLGWARELAKDGRWMLSGRRFPDIDPFRYAAAPFVWQHHDRFHSQGSGLAKRLGLPLVHFVDAPNVWEAEQWGVSRGPFGRVVERLGETPQARAADVVACVSDEVARAVRVRLGVPSERILVTPCTVDSRRFKTASNAGEVKRQLGIPDDAVIVGWIGSFRPFHSLDLLVEALALVATRSKNVHLVLVGDGPTRASIIADVASRGLEHRVLLPGAVPNSKVPDVLRTFDIAALPSGTGHFHYSPLKLREFAAAGAAIIAPNVGGITSTFVAGVEAVIVTPGSPSELADAIVELSTDPLLRGRLSTAAKAAAERRFGMGPILDSLDERLAAL